MSLPPITIPVELPLDIPVLLHPALVHFVIAIPVIIILLEIINLFFKKRALSVFSLFLILLVALFMTAAYFTGGVDGKETFSLLAEAGKSELKEHKLLGAYLVYASLGLVALKLLFMAFSAVIARLFFILLLIGFTGVILKQGKDGGELVYKYGANNQALVTVNDEKVSLQDDINDLKEEVAELEADIKEKAEEAKSEEPEEKKEATPETASPAPEATTETATSEEESSSSSEATTETKEETTSSEKEDNATVSLETP